METLFVPSRTPWSFESSLRNSLGVVRAIMASVERRSHGVRTIPTENGLGSVREIMVSEPVAQES